MSNVFSIFSGATPCENLTDKDNNEFMKFAREQWNSGSSHMLNCRDCTMRYVSLAKANIANTLQSKDWKTVVEAIHSKMPNEIFDD
jgi:hypothetical protein